MKKKIWDRFQEVSNIIENIELAFPAASQKPIRDRALQIARLLGQSIREDELEDKEHVDSLVQLSLSFAPHITLDDKLREAAEAKESTVGVITDILKTARVAELSSFGRIAFDRIKVIEDSPSRLWGRWGKAGSGLLRGGPQGQRTKGCAARHRAY